MGEESKLTIAEAAELSGVSEAAIRDRLHERAARTNGVALALTRQDQGPPSPAGRLGPEQEPDPEHEPGVRLTLELVEHLERQAAEIAELRAAAASAESLSQELGAQQVEREELETELEAARSEIRSLKSHMAGLRGRQERRLMIENELVRTQADLEATKAQLAEVSTTWRDWFRWARMPDSLTPGRARTDEKRQSAMESELAEARRELQDARRRIAELEQREQSAAKLEEDLAAAQAELEAARARITELARGRRAWRGLLRH